MDAIEILGDLLGRKTQSPGRGADVLRDIFGRGSRQSPNSPSTSSSPPLEATEISREAEKLEKLLNVANGRISKHGSGMAGPDPPAPKTAPQSQSPAKRPDGQTEQIQDTENQRAIVLIRAMVNAVKSDGQLDEREQQKMFEQLGNPTRENVEYLRKMLTEPLDVQEFVRSVPFGMEQQVYTMSLIAIDLDTRDEANYLVRLADGLRIPVEVRKQIHQRLGAPYID